MGYAVRATEDIKSHTMICEYTGDVILLRKSVLLTNDSKMILMKTGRAATTLIIMPVKHANIAKFIGGINNDDETS